MYSSKKYQSVLDKAIPLLEKVSANADLNLVIGRTIADQADYKNAVPYLENTVKLDRENSWKKAWALNYLGTCYFMLEDYDDSGKALNECIRLNATRNATNDAYGKSVYFGFNEFYNNWKLLETQHFRFHFQDMNDADIEKYVALRENAFKGINEFFEGEIPKKIDFFVWQSNDDAKKILKANLGFARPEYCLVHSSYQQTIGHEMTHVISNYSREIEIKTFFINEGTAVCFDLTVQDRVTPVKKWMAENKMKVSIKECWENENYYPVEILYPLSGLFVKALIDNYGNDKFMNFFRNQTYENAKNVFGDQLDTFIQEFEDKMNS